MAVRGFPLVGDRCNGRRNKRHGRISLHVRRLPLTDSTAFGELTGPLLQDEAIDLRPSPLVRPADFCLDAGTHLDAEPVLSEQVERASTRSAGDHAPDAMGATSASEVAVRAINFPMVAMIAGLPLLVPAGAAATRAGVAVVVAASAGAAGTKLIAQHLAMAIAGRAVVEAQAGALVAVDLLTASTHGAVLLT